MKAEKISRSFSQYNTLIIFIVMLVISGFITDNFFTANNISNLLR